LARQHQVEAEPPLREAADGPADAGQTAKHQVGAQVRLREHLVEDLHFAGEAHQRN
jgi:hypothetical protein